MSRIAWACAILAAVITASPVVAQTLYKLIDKNGKVTYSESPPKEFDGQVIRLDIDPKANTATMPKAPASDAAAQKATAAKQQIVDDRLRFAQQQLESARKALQEARDNPGDQDITHLGNAKGGGRLVPSDAYLQRLARLEEEVKRAEEAVARAEQAR